MADMTFTIAGRSKTHTVSSAHTAKWIDCYKTIMAQSNQGWPDDEQNPGKKREPTTAEIIDWVCEFHLFEKMRDEVREHMRGLLRAQFIADKNNVEGITSTVA